MFIRRRPKKVDADKHCILLDETVDNPSVFSFLAPIHGGFWLLQYDRISYTKCIEDLAVVYNQLLCGPSNHILYTIQLDQTFSWTFSDAAESFLVDWAGL